MFKEILEYIGEYLKKVVLSNYEGYDPRRPGRTCKHNHYKIVVINHTKKYESFDPFIIAQNIRQAYYLPYPVKCKSNWIVVVTTKVRGQVKAKKVSNEAYQVDDPIPMRVVVDTDILPNILSTSGEVDIIDLSSQCLRMTIEDGERYGSNEDEEEEFMDDVKSKSDEDSLKLLD